MVFTRDDIISRLNAALERGEIIVGTTAGIGLVAKCQEAGGADIIAVDYGARLRMAGVSSLAANLSSGRAVEVVSSLSSEVLPVVKNTPVLCGICATEPFATIDMLLDDAMNSGYSGVYLSPSIGWNSPSNIKNLDKQNIGLDREAAFIARAKGRGIFSAAYCHTAESCRMMSAAGADMVVVTVGATVGGFSGVKSALTMEESVQFIDGCTKAAKGENENIKVLFTGGIFSSSESVAKLISLLPEVDGFMGGSSTDRLPMEEGLTEGARLFKKTKLK